VKRYTTIECVVFVEMRGVAQPSRRHHEYEEREESLWVDIKSVRQHVLR